MSLHIENGTDPSQIKLVHELTADHIREIAWVTGASLDEATYIPVCYNHERSGLLIPTRVIFARFGAGIDFARMPHNPTMNNKLPYLTFDNFLISLTGTAVVIGKDDVTFVRRPQASEVSTEILITTIGISRESGITLKKQPLPIDGSQSLRQEIMIGAALVEPSFNRAR